MVNTQDMRIDVCSVMDAHSRVLSTIGSDKEAVVLIISFSGRADNVAVFVVFSEDMRVVNGAVFADGHGHEIAVAGDKAASSMGHIDLSYTQHTVSVVNALKNHTILTICNEGGQVSIADGQGNREDFQTTVLQDFKDLGLEYTIKDGRVVRRELSVLPSDTAIASS